MSWGYKIIIVYIIFAAGILLLVYMASTQNADLVTTDYYEKELKYQQKIDIDKQTAALSQPLRFDQDGMRFSIHLPVEFYGKKVSGDIILYCPSDQRKDQRQHFSLQEAKNAILFQALHKGMNILQVSWRADSISYYFEQKVMIL